MVLDAQVGPGPGHWPSKSDVEVARLVEDLYLAAADGEVEALVDKVNPFDATALRCALRYVEEWSVVVESRRLNTERGVAPSSEAILEQIENNRQRAPRLFRGKPRGFGGSGRKRVHRLRTRWGGRYGSIPVGQRLSPEVARAKASTAKYRLGFSGGEFMKKWIGFPEKNVHRVGKPRSDLGAPGAPRACCALIV